MGSIVFGLLARVVQWPGELADSGQSQDGRHGPYALVGNQWRMAGSRWQFIHHSGPQFTLPPMLVVNLSQMPPTYLALAVHYLIAESAGDEPQRRWQKFRERAGPLQEI